MSPPVSPIIDIALLIMFFFIIGAVVTEKFLDHSKFRTGWKGKLKRRIADAGGKRTMPV